MFSFLQSVTSFLSLESKRSRDAEKPLQSIDDLSSFISRHSAYVAQRATLEYCRARTGLNWDKIFKEEAFSAGLKICQWMAYGAVASDIALLLEDRFAEISPLSPENHHRLFCEIHAVGLDAYAEHADWSAEKEDFTVRLHERQAARAAGEALEVHLLGKVSGARIFAALPIHPSLRNHDKEMVENNLCFALVNVSDALNRVLDPVGFAREGFAPQLSESLAVS